MAFVLVQHLAPDHKSALADILAKVTSMAVAEAGDGMAVAPDRVFVIPPDATLTIEGGILRVAKPAPPREHRRPIDTFFSSLADDQGENAVCIVLSGTGSDGTLGLSAIKENGGLTMAQAEFDHSAMSGMPHSAVATGLVDAVLPVEDMPGKLVSYERHLRKVSHRKEADGTRRDAAAHLATIARLLRTRMGHDFTHYKEKTLTRRIQRRMQVLQIDTVPGYIARLKDEPQQLDLLFRELLIGVTQFFRDPDAFAALETIFIPKLLEGKSGGEAIRAWVPGCATGEEVYSVAIILKEALEKRGVDARIQIFGTDIDDKAVAVARAGRFLKTEGVSPERLRRWFIEDGEEFCPVREIREMCVFSVQSVIKDAPFSRLDMISCRNLLIYMDSDLQDRVLRTFHYALRPDGLLFLGPSEGVTRQAKYFAALDRKHRIFQRKDVDAALPELALASQLSANPQHKEAGPPIAGGEDRIARKARHAMEKYSPAWLIIDGNHDILRFSGGEAGRFLEPVAGAASLNLFAILRTALRPVVRAAVRTALATQRPVLRDNIAIRIDGKNRIVTAIVEPIADDTEQGLCVVAFQDTENNSRGMNADERKDTNNADVLAIEHELRTVKTQLQSTIDDLETANEEMKSAAEEYQSVNEELQSSNEELETSKEEMQSINEELQTVNSEMSAKNDLLVRLNSDLKNLLDSTNMAVLFLDNELRIKTFTPPMTDIFHLRDADRGRPITEIVSMLDYSDLTHDAREVLRKLSVLEREVRLADKAMTFILRIRPYRSLDNVIDGVVMTFMDISERKVSEEQSALLLRELDHRVKNILAVVSSVITQTLKASESPAAFAASMEGR
jgi:two-component system CheB/CheR fusion protein